MFVNDAKTIHHFLIEHIIVFDCGNCIVHQSKWLYWLLALLRSDAVTVLSEFKKGFNWLVSYYFRTRYNLMMSLLIATVHNLRDGQQKKKQIDKFLRKKRKEVDSNNRNNLMGDLSWILNEIKISWISFILSIHSIQLNKICKFGKTNGKSYFKYLIISISTLFHSE